MEVKLVTAGQTVSAQIKLPRKVLASILGGVITVIGAVTYHVADTYKQLSVITQQLADCQKEQKKATERIQDLERMIAQQFNPMPGGNNGQSTSGPPQVPTAAERAGKIIAPDTTRKVH